MRIIAGLESAGTSKSLSKTAGIAEAERTALLGTTFNDVMITSSISNALFRIDKIFTKERQ
jgi:hypothetical protein